MQHMTKRVEIIPAKRRAMILDHLRRDGAASIQELAAQTGASSSSIRRDLEQLVEGGYLERTHGGALLMPAQRAAFEREPAINALMRTEEKRAIGAEAARRLRPRDSVIFEASSTVLEAALAATAMDLSLTVVTNSLDIASASAAVPDWRVIVPGGTIRPGSRMLAGEPGHAFFQSVHADVCFLGAYAVTGSVLTDATLEIASLKRAMISASRRIILLVDSTKFGEAAFSTFCDLAAIDEVITDDGIQPDHLASLRSVDVEVTVVAAKR